jgi:hypothetical protein
MDCCVVVIGNGGMSAVLYKVPSRPYKHHNARDPSDVNMIPYQNHIIITLNVGGISDR